MITGLKVLFLAYKCVFYRPKNNAKEVCKCVFYGQKQNAKEDPMNCILMVLKCKNKIHKWIQLNEYEKKCHFFVFCADNM